MIRIQWRISGMVQGVGFRDFAQRTARHLGVRGWVRNLPDGDVELLAEADPQTLTQFEQHIRRGPPGGRITQLTAVVPPSDEPLNGFEVRRTPW